jgi:hypothetical protein
MTKPKVIKIISKSKDISIDLSREAKSILRRKPITNIQLLKMLNGIDEDDMPDSAQVRMLALECLEGRGFKIFDKNL